MPARHGDLPIAAYAAIGDGRTAALVGRDGSIDWLCQGRFDGPAVFCRLLDAERGGFFGIAPAGGHEAARRYLEGTSVLVTDLETATGRARITDAMLDAPQPTLVRRVEGLAGHVELELELAPTFDFARSEARLEATARGCLARGRSGALALGCPTPVAVDGSRALATLAIAAGETRWVTLTEGGDPPGDADAAQALDETIVGWRRWSERCRVPSCHAALVRRSALVLKLLIHAPSGAMVAAPTTSLPEDPGGVRNWDYRFNWLRDASWLVGALMDLDQHDESMAFLDWLERLDLAGGDPAVFYDLDGRPPGDERVLEHLLGHRGSRPVRVGNAAARQDQHDVFGEVVAAVFTCSEAMPSMRPLRPGLWRLVSRFAECAARHGPHADRGLWEVRDRPRHFVSSKLLCWVALDRALAIARRDGLDAPAGRWSDARDALRGAILQDGYDASAGVFRQSFGGTELDAAALLLPRHDFLPAGDPRVVRTTDAIQRELGDSGLLRRYAGGDGLPGRDGAFAACSFWLAESLAQQGRLDAAHAAFESVVRHANDVGLLAEQIDPSTGALLGNFPQALTHLALIRAARAIADAESSARRPRPSTSDTISAGFADAPSARRR